MENEIYFVAKFRSQGITIPYELSLKPFVDYDFKVLTKLGAYKSEYLSDDENYFFTSKVKPMGLNSFAIRIPKTCPLEDGKIYQFVVHIKGEKSGTRKKGESSVLAESLQKVR